MTAAAQGARKMMTMRAFAQRDGTSTTDAYGHPDGPSWATLATYPCRVWSKSRKETVDGRKYALIEDIRCSMPLGTDITEKDRLSSVKDRLGTVIWAGPLRIDTIQHKHTHLEMALLRVQS